MSREDLPPLDEQTRALIANEAAQPDDVPADVRASLARRLGSLMTAPPGPSGHEGDGGGPGDGGATTATAAAKSGLVRALAIFVVGAAAGAGGATAMLSSSPKVEIRYVDRVVVAPTPPAATSSAPPVDPRGDEVAPPSSAEPARVATAKTAPSAVNDALLVRERSLIEIARSAIARRDAGAALDTLAQHAKQFPRGQFVEEREALAIQALVLAGRRDEGKARAETFRRRFPRGLFLPVVEAAISDER
jgi:hypothetical protein